MDNKYYGQFIIMQATIETNKQEMKPNKQYPDDKIMKVTEYVKAMIISTFTSMMDHINTLKPSTVKRDSPSFRNLPTWYRITGGIHHWTMETLKKLVACGISNMISDHQNYTKSSSRKNSKETLLWTSRTSTTTPRYVSMW